MECGVFLWVFEVLRYTLAQKLNREYCQQDAIVPSSGYPSISLRCLRCWSYLRDFQGSPKAEILRATFQGFSRARFSVYGPLFEFLSQTF